MVVVTLAVKACNVESVSGGCNYVTAHVQGSIYLQHGLVGEFVGYDVARNIAFLPV